MWRDVNHHRVVIVPVPERMPLDLSANCGDSWRVDDYVPMAKESWDFLVGLKEATEAGFARMESHFVELSCRMDGLEHRMDRLEQRMDALEHRMDALEHRMDGLEHRMDGLEHRMNRFEHRLILIDDRLSCIEDLRIGIQLRDHEQRIANLER